MKSIKLVIAAMIACVVTANTFAEPVAKIQEFAHDVLDSAEFHGVYSATLDGRRGFGAATLFKVKRFTIKDTVNIDVGPAYVIMNAQKPTTRTEVRQARATSARPVWNRTVTVEDTGSTVRNVIQVAAGIGMAKPDKLSEKLSNLPIIKNFNLDFTLTRGYVGVGTFVDEFEPVFSVGFGGIGFGE